MRCACQFASNPKGCCPELCVAALQSEIRRLECELFPLRILRQQRRRRYVTTNVPNQAARVRPVLSTDMSRPSKPAVARLGDTVLVFPEGEFVLVEPDPRCFG